MALTINGKTAAKPRGQRGHTLPRPLTISLGQPGRLYTGHLLSIIQVAHSTFHSGVKSGRFPKPDGYDGNRPFWNTETVRVFLAMPRSAIKPKRFTGNSIPATEAERQAEIDFLNQRIANLSQRRALLLAATNNAGLDGIEVTVGA